MALDIYSTYYMLAAVATLTPEHTFFKNRYFPTNNAMDVFGTSKVLIDYKDRSKQRRAPFVMPRVGAIPIGRDGFSTYELEPTNISISRPLTLDQLQNRGFGESLMSGLTPDQRESALLMEDLAELSARISRTEEWMACQTMLDNGCTMAHRTDNEDIYENVHVQFYDGASNPALYTPAATWAHSTYNSTTGAVTVGNWYTDIQAMIKMLTRRGLPARELIVSSDVGEFLLEDPWILKVLDNRRMEFGRIDPSQLTEYVTYLGTFNFGGRSLDILINDGTFLDVDANGNDVDTPYLPDGTAIVTAPNCGRGLYGAVTLMETDGNFHTYAGTRVPQHYFSQRPAVKETILTARPLMVPNTESPWSVAKNVL